MSEFDFDALRDPDAPFPGTRERAAVDARARQLRGRQRRNRLTASATSIVAVAAILFGVIATTRDTGPQIAVPGTTVPATTTTVTTPTSAGPSVDDRFIPPTSVQNGLVTLPVTLPDGESFTMRYPPAMKIAQLGFAGGGGVVGSSGVSSRQVSVDYTNIQRAYGDQQPLAVYMNANHQAVPLYAGKEPTLAFEFGHWLVRVSDGNASMTESQLATWARDLTGTVDASGYLVLHAQSPLTVANWFDGGFGSFTKGNSVELANHFYCGQPESDTAAHRRFRNGDGKRGVSWCDGDLHVSASGAPSFVDLADHQLTVSATTPAVGPTPTSPSTTNTTTTTTAPSTKTIPPAESATFVSPSQGWVIEKNGRVDATTDAGAHWGVASAIPIPGPTSKIRFADATHGFAFGFVPNGGAPLWSTTDGGAHWAALNLPFSDVFDLAIARGVVYVVAQQQSNSDFRIWSAPADTLAWKEDPLVIPHGAGPVPSIQLVLSGSNGWIVEVDRVISGGARLSSSGRWVAWNPPSCGEGPGDLAASSSTDLVMACNEGVWGGNLPHITPTVYFSHDGGTTFSRHLAPLNGLVTSPNPRTAVVAGGDTVQMTTDEGAHWSIVADVHDPSAYTPTDIGFTTTTQGFVILGDGQMLMTYDAGATWPRARLP